MPNLDIEDNDNKYAFLPIKYPQLYEYVEKQQNNFWTAKHVNYGDDRAQFDTLSKDEQTYIEFLLFLFAQLDGLVNENLVENFKRETSKWKECSMFYAIQEAIEWVHNETYSLLLKNLIRDPVKQSKGLNSIKYYPSIKKIAEWCSYWMDPKKPLIHRVVAFACIEGIIFSSAFAGIYWIKRMNILKGLTQANEWIARDEGIHTQFAVALYHFLTITIKEYSPAQQQEIHQIICSAVTITEEFSRNAMNCEFVGLNADDLVTYIKCTADNLSTSLGYDSIYNVENKLDWMIIISLPNKTNFFEARVSEYKQQVSSDFKFDLNIPF